MFIVGFENKVPKKVVAIFVVRDGRVSSAENGAFYYPHHPFTPLGARVFELKCTCFHLKDSFIPGCQACCRGDG